MTGRPALPNCDHSPPHLTGGSGRTGPSAGPAEFRGKPQIGLSDCDSSYASLIVQGWDSFQETLNLRPELSIERRLDGMREVARSSTDQGGEVVSFDFGGESVQMQPTAPRGHVWRFGNDDFQYLIRSPKTAWCVSIRYSAAGLWEHGLEALRSRAYSALIYAGWHTTEGNHTSPARADWAFDFYAPGFTPEMAPGVGASVVAHSSVKIRSDAKVPVYEHGPAGRVETLTIGSKAGLQVQVYDKTREITEASGKTWMVALWEREGFWPPDGELRDVWRLEVRFGKGFLRDRNITEHGQLVDSLPALLCEALYTRRLVAPSPTDSNRRRWPLHPLWSQAVRTVEADGFVPLGRYVTGARGAISDQLTNQIAGTIRSTMVLEDGHCDPDALGPLMERVRKRLASDPARARKEQVARERYRYVDEAR